MVRWSYIHGGMVEKSSRWQFRVFYVASFSRTSTLNTQPATHQVSILGTKQSTSMKIPTPTVALALAIACVSPQQSFFSSAFVPSSTKIGTRCASNQNSPHHTVRPLASADESSTTSTRRPEWSPSSWRDVKDDEQDATEDESIVRAAKKISR